MALGLQEMKGGNIFKRGTNKKNETKQLQIFQLLRKS